MGIASTEGVLRSYLKITRFLLGNPHTGWTEEKTHRIKPVAFAHWCGYRQNLLVIKPMLTHRHVKNSIGAMEEARRVFRLR